jgi:hypothetical protein
MTENVQIIVSVTPEERDRIETLARERGYDDPAAYLRALAEADAEDEDEDEDSDDIREDIKQGLREAFKGEGIPLAEFWKKLHDK